jgi:hypothetical protein
MDAHMAPGGRLCVTAVVAACLAPSPSFAKSPPPPSEPALPAAELRVSVSESGPDEQWVLKLENTSGTRLRVADDPRLLWMEVALPGQTKPRVCRLPEDLFPKAATSDMMRELPPGEAITRHFDPRFYCFSAGKQETLVPTAQITPHYGWPGKTKSRWSKGRRVEEKLPDAAPFFAEPVASTTLGPAKNVSGDIVALDGRYAAWSDTPPADDDDGDEPTLEITRGSDAQTEMQVIATVRVKNPSKSRVALFVRRELLTFEVMTHAGTVSCVSEPDARNPDRRAFSTLPPHGSMTIVSRLVELCPRGTFVAPGLYLVHARLDASADGSEFGLDAFTGTLRTARPATVRVRHALRLIPNRFPSKAGGPPGAPAPPGAPPNVPQMMPPPDAPPPPPPPPPPAPGP